MTTKQKLMLFLISCEPGFRDIYTMVKLYDRADFPSNVTENLQTLLQNGFIVVTENFDNGTPNKYGITEKDKSILIGILMLLKSFITSKQWIIPSNFCLLRRLILTD